MSKNRKRLLIGSAVTGIVLAGCVFGYFLSGANVGLSLSDVNAVLKDRERLNRNWWEPVRLTDSSGTEWYVPVAEKPNERLCWRIINGQRQEIGDFAPPGYSTFFHHAAVLLPADQLIVICDGPGRTIAASVYDGKKWLAPCILATNVSPSCMDAAVDATGRVHVIFVAPLTPYESYGPIEGFFPSKCWYVCYDGQTWSQPKPIQKRGRFGVSDAIITRVPSGRMVVSFEVRDQFSPGDPHLSVQLLGDTGWSEIGRLRRQ